MRIEIQDLVDEAASAIVDEARGVAKVAPKAAKALTAAVATYARIAYDPDISEESKVVERAHLESVVRNVKARMETRSKRAIDRLVVKALKIAERIVEVVL